MNFKTHTKILRGSDPGPSIHKHKIHKSFFFLLTKTVKTTEVHTNQEILFDIAKLAAVDSNYVQLTKTIADAVIEHEINHETELFYTQVTLEGKPVPYSDVSECFCNYMYISYGGSAMLSMMIGLGIAMSCKVHQQDSEN